MSRLLPLILAVSVASGCAHHTEKRARPTSADSVTCATYFARFVVVGTILAADGAAVPYAEAHFIDMGLDYHRGRQDRAERIGVANSAGVLDQGFDYGWCNQTSCKALGLEALDSSRDAEADRDELYSEALREARADAKLPQPIAIEIRADGFKPHRVEFDLSQLPDVDGPYILELGVVTLEVEFDAK